MMPETKARAKSKIQYKIGLYVKVGRNCEC